MHLWRDWPLLLSSLAGLTGLALGTLVGTRLTGLLVVLVAGLALLGAALWAVRQADWLIIPLLGLMVCAGAGWALLWSTSHPVVASSQLVDGATATIVSAVDRVGRQERAYVDLVLPSGPVRVRATWSPTGDTVRYGDRFEVSGELEPPRQDSTFDERGFLLAHHAQGRLNVGELEPLPGRGGVWILQRLHDLRLILLGRLQAALDPPFDGIVAGVLIGDQSGLPTQIEEAFRRTGTTHILVASGSNLVLLAGIVQLALRGLGRRASRLGTAAILLGFVIISGAEASVVRAALFFTILLLAELTGRRSHLPTAIASVALVMAFESPWILLHDIGFQLSFGAVIGLVLLTGPFAALLPTLLLRMFLAPTLAAWLGTLPLLVYHFGQASLSAPLANLLVLPMVEVLMGAGLATLLLPWLPIVPWLTEGVARLMVLVVNGLADLPWSAATLPAHHLGWTLAAIALTGVALLVLGRRRRQLVPEPDARGSYDAA